MVLEDDSPKLWGGIECTVNRVGEQYFDQLNYSGHAQRASDLALFAGLGLKTLRYPVLWERCESMTGTLDFAWTDERLSELQRLGIDPIVGLVHHGSGPRHTSLLDPAFPSKLADYARRVAERYPWLRRYTPINEPLTTARFSGLYGHWYPHARDDASFVRALLGQCRAISLAMRAVRAVCPEAELVQTEDMGFTRSTPELAYQAEFENQRRWLSLDLLCGRVDARHPLYRYLRRSGAREHELAFFRESPCVPDLIGINYYVTSERFLDGRLTLYPRWLIGGNGRHRYADVEAVRVCQSGLIGPSELLCSASQRYGRPVAITEAHLGCSVDEQMRWLAFVWRAALRAHKLGARVRAVTVWALLGSYDWDSLVTRQAFHYEPGAFAVRDGVPVRTPLADFVERLPRGAAEEQHGGWWQSPARFLYPSYPDGTQELAVSGIWQRRRGAEVQSRKLALVKP